MNRSEILKRLEGDVSLPALPEVLSRLEGVLADPDADVRDVAKLVQTDPVLSGQLLRMANSAYYSRGGQPVANVQAAIQRLGSRAVKGLVYALTLPRLFQGGGRFPHRALWKHSLAVAGMSAELVKVLGGTAAERDLAYFAGLVHDIGALLLAQLDPDYVGFLERALERRETSGWDERDLADLESAEFGIDHAEVGAIFLADRWRSPQPVPRLVRHHHGLGWETTTDDPDVRRLVAILHVANGVSNHAGIGWDGLPTEGLAFRESAWEHLGLDLSTVDSLVERMSTSVEHAETLLSAGA